MKHPRATIAVAAAVLGCAGLGVAASAGASGPVATVDGRPITDREVAFHAGMVDATVENEVRRDTTGDGSGGTGPGSGSDPGTGPTGQESAGGPPGPAATGAAASAPFIVALALLVGGGIAVVDSRRRRQDRRR